MHRFIAIAINAFMELIRQPVFLILLTSSAAFTVFLASVPYFGFGDDAKLVKDSVLAVMLLSGLFGAVISASASLAHEIRAGTALTVLSKPVSRAQFLLAKYLGLAGALVVLTYVNTVSSLLASRMTFDAYGDTDLPALAIFAGGMIAAYLVAAAGNFFFRRQFVSDAVFALVGVTTVAFVLIISFTKQISRIGEESLVDWRLVPAAVLILFALLILAGIALACSTRFEMIPTLAICTGIFLLGLMSDYLFGRRAETGSWWASIVYAVVPNWQLFWLADALENGKVIPWTYVGRAFGYVVGYLGASLALALLLFEDRELS